MANEKLEKLYKEKIQKSDPEYIREFIRQKPSKKWEYHRSDKVLSYKLTHEVNPAAKGKMDQWLKQYPLYDTGNGMITEAVIRQNERTTRFDFSNKGMYRGDVSYIINENDDIMHLDRQLQCYLHLENKVAPRFAFTDKGEIEISKGKEEKWNNLTVTKVTVNVLRPEVLKYELFYWNDVSVKPFTDNVCKAILGCDDKMKEAGVSLKALREYGIPVKGKLYYQTGQREWVRITSFELSDIKVEKAADGVFDIPPKYTDLRDYNKKFTRDGKQHYPGPAVRVKDAIDPEFIYKPRFPRDDANDEPRPTHGQTGAALTAVNNELRFPECFPSTYASLVANDVDEKVLDDIKWLVNGVTKRLSGFSGSGGNVDIDWLAQFGTASAALGGGPGSGLFDIMRDPTGHLGLLDKMATKNVQQLLVDGTITADLNFSGQAALLANVNTSLGLPGDQRWDSLSAGNQFTLVELYVEQRLAHFKLTYPASVGWQTVFHGLVKFKIDDIEFSIAINNKPVISTLQFDPDSIHLVIDLDNVTGKGWLTRAATGKYWGLVAVSWLGCFFVPLLCTLAVALTVVGAFLLMDIAFVSISISNLSIDSRIRFLPNGVGVLQPDVTLSLTGSVNVSYTSAIPSGVHQILAFIYTTVANSTNLVLNTIESQLQDKLNTFVKQDLNLSYPPAFGPVPLTGLSSLVEFATNDNLYLQAGLNAGLLGITSPFITQVEKDVKQNLLTFRQDFKNAFTDPVTAFNATNLLAWASKPDFRDIARYYLGSVISQNFLNHYVYTLWRRGDFNYDFRPHEAEQVFLLIQPHFPQFKNVNPKHVRAHLWPATSPRTVLTPYPASKGEYYAATFMDDVRLCIEIGEKKTDQVKDNRIELLFAAEAFTELGFGGRVPGKTLDILKVTDRVFDIYFDTKKFTIKPIHPEVYSFRMQSVTLSSTIDYSPLLQMDPAFELACQFAFADRSSTQIPRDAVDPTTIQRYPVGFEAYTPDGAFMLVFQLLPFRGNIYVNTGLSGKGTAILEGSNMDIDQMDSTTAQLLRIFI
ncbi:MAG: hypothetical protein WCF67_14610 [Chitinophagaceae bacterium]